MAEYHVGCGAFAIYAGTLNSKNKTVWQNRTECTDEAICAVRDYLVQECLGGLHGDKPSGGYEWTLKDGRVVRLLVAIVGGGDSNAFPEVVTRCKDCVHWDDDPDTYGTDDGPKGKCMKSFETMCADDFCSYGERKEKP